LLVVAVAVAAGLAVEAAEAVSLLEDLLHLQLHTLLLLVVVATLVHGTLLV
jgi:hypothetical protein